MKPALLLFCFFISLTAFGQVENRDSIPPLPTKRVSQLVTISCFPTKVQENHTLGPDGSKVRGEHYESLNQIQQISSRSGLRGQYAHYYINGIRVRQDFTPGDIIEDVDIMTNSTPAFDEGVPISPKQDLLLIY